MSGSFVHTLVMTDIATGWTECIALAARQQHLVTEALNRVRKRLPFPLLGFDSITTVHSSTKRSWSIAGNTGSSSRVHVLSEERSGVGRAEEWRHRPQVIGYKRFEGLAVAQIIAALYEYSRLYT